MFQKKKSFLLFLVVILTLSFSNLTFANSSISVNNTQTEEQNFVPHTKEYPINFYFTDARTREVVIVPAILTVSWLSQEMIQVTVLNKSPNRGIERILISVYACDKDGFIGSHRNEPIIENKDVGYAGPNIAVITKVKVPKNNNYLSIGVTAIPDVKPGENFLPTSDVRIFSRF